MKAMTVSLVRHRMPREMFADLLDEGYAAHENYPGIFTIDGPMFFPAQVVVTSRLPSGEYEALKILTTKAEKADVLKFIEEAHQSGSVHSGAVLQVSIAANRELYWKLKKEGLMVGAFEELFHEELSIIRAEARGEGRAENCRTIRDRLITEKGWDPQEAAEFVGLTGLAGALA